MLSIKRCGAHASLLLLFCAAYVGAAPLPLEETPAVKDLNTPRDFPHISSSQEWQIRARQIREQILISAGLWPLPEKTPLHSHIFGKIERDGYSIEKVYFQTSPGFYLAGNLYRPLGRGKGPFPAILNPHGHWKEGRLADTKDGSIPARCISFARQGMIAFSYDMVGFNDTHFADARTNQPFYNTHRLFATNKTDQLWNISLMGLQTWNSIRALDFLESLPGADRKRLACTGESGGGTQTFMLGAVDDRLAAQAPVVMVSHTMQGGCSCENMPGLRVEYSNMEIAAAAAPRPQIMVAATGDWTKDMLTVEGPALESVYRLFNAPDRLRYVQFDFGHNYNQTSREAVYDWFRQWLLIPTLVRLPIRLGDGSVVRPTASPAFKEAPYEKEPDAALRVFPDGKLPNGAMTMESFTESLKKRTEAQWNSLALHSKTGLEMFRQVMLPAWQHTLQDGWSPEDSAVVRAGALSSGSTSARSTVVVLARAAQSARASSNSETQLAVLLNKLNIPCIAVAQVNRSQDQFAKFFTTYNRSDMQRQVGKLISACASARDNQKNCRVVLCGLGRAGLAALLAAPAADAVIADCDQLDVSSDDALLAQDLFCPGIRNIGTFEGAPMLAAPHPLLLHNTGQKFSTATLRSTYKAVGATSRLRVEVPRLSDNQLADWIATLK